MLTGAWRRLTHSNAVWRGPIEVTLHEKLLLQRVELDAIHDIYRYIKLERLRGGHREASQ